MSPRFNFRSPVSASGRTPRRRTNRGFALAVMVVVAATVARVVLDGCLDQDVGRGRREAAGRQVGRDARARARRNHPAGRRPGRVPPDPPEPERAGQGLPLRRGVLVVHRRPTHAPGLPGRGARHRIRREHAADLRPGGRPGHRGDRRLGVRERHAGARHHRSRHQGLGRPGWQAGRLPAGDRGRSGPAPGARSGGNRSVRGHPGRRAHHTDRGRAQGWLRRRGHLGRAVDHQVPHRDAGRPDGGAGQRGHGPHELPHRDPRGARRPGSIRCAGRLHRPGRTWVHLPRRPSGTAGRLVLREAVRTDPRARRPGAEGGAGRPHSCWSRAMSWTNSSASPTSS